MCTPESVLYAHMQRHRGSRTCPTRRPISSTTPVLQACTFTPVEVPRLTVQLVCDRMHMLTRPSWRSPRAHSLLHLLVPTHCLVHLRLRPGAYPIRYRAPAGPFAPSNSGGQAL